MADDGTPRVVIEVNDPGECRVTLHGDDGELFLRYSYECPPSREHVKAAQEWVRRLGELLGVALDVDVRDETEASPGVADEWSDWAPASVEGQDEGSGRG